MSEPQSQHADTTSGHNDPLGVGAIRPATSEAPTQPPPEHQRSSEAQGVSVELLARYEARLHILAQEVEMLKSVIMALNLTELAAGFHKISTDFKKAERLIKA